jgi:hypothetical protein
MATCLILAASVRHLPSPPSLLLMPTPWVPYPRDLSQMKRPNPFYYQILGCLPLPQILHRSLPSHQPPKSLSFPGENPFPPHMWLKQKQSQLLRRRSLFRIQRQVLLQTCLLISSHFGMSALHPRWIARRLSPFRIHHHHHHRDRVEQAWATRRSVFLSLHSEKLKLGVLA